MLRAIRLVAAGESLLSPSVTRRVIESFASRSPIRKTHPHLSELTDREREVLALIGEGLSNDEIAERLVVSRATARTHVSRAMIKLRARDRAQLVVIAYQSGLVRCEHPTLRGTLTLYLACMPRTARATWIQLVLITSQTSGSVDPGGVRISAACAAIQPRCSKTNSRPTGSPWPGTASCGRHQPDHRVQGGRPLIRNRVGTKRRRSG